jgi:hypothetical protein
MYGGEHGFLLHTAMVLGSWLVFFALCVLPFVLIVCAYLLGFRKGRQAERHARAAETPR